jgi:hypothetical protein
VAVVLVSSLLLIVNENEVRGIGRRGWKVERKGERTGEVRLKLTSKLPRRRPRRDGLVGGSGIRGDEVSVTEVNPGSVSPAENVHVECGTVLEFPRRPNNRGELEGEKYDGTDIPVAISYRGQPSHTSSASSSIS